MCFFRKRHRQQDRIAREIASRHDLLDDYLVARSHGLSPLEALEDWDLLDADAWKLLEAAETHPSPPSLPTRDNRV